MKTKFLKSLTLMNRQRIAVALLSLVCLVALALTQGTAQVKSQRRVTSMQLGEAFEGSRVTLVSDSALSDYEAFRRGDRFYVKIPSAEFTTTPPHLRANGFEDVQIQKVSDGLIISFKLQAGASARVDLRGNRLDVIFSAPNRSSYLASRNATTRVENSVTRDRDAAGPVPPVSGSAARDRGVSESTTEGSDGQSLQDPWAVNPTGNSGRRSKRSNNQAGSVAIETPSPLLTPTPYQPSSTYPGVTAATTPASSSAIRPNGSSTLRQRISALRNWMSGNRLASLVGALILLGLIVFLVMVLRNRRPAVAKPKRAKIPKVQPRYSEVSELSDVSASSTGEPVVAPKNEPARVANNLSDSAANRNVAAKRQEPQTAAVPAAAVANGRSHWTSKPAATSAATATAEYSSDEEEREVFEL